MSTTTTQAPRTTIRNGIANLLFNKTQAGKNVYPGRFRPLTVDEHPAIIVLTEDEQVEALSATREKRTLDIIVRCVVCDGILANETSQQSAARLQDGLDDLAYQCEQALAAAAQPSWVQLPDGVLSDLSLSSYRGPEFLSSSERQMAQAELVFTGVYYTNKLADMSQAAPFLRFVGDFDVVQQDGQIDITARQDLQGI
jgi:hypothetical protein